MNIFYKYLLFWKSLVRYLFGIPAKILNFYEVAKSYKNSKSLTSWKFKIMAGIPITYRTKDFQNSTYRKCSPLGTFEYYSRSKSRRFKICNALRYTKHSFIKRCINPNFGNLAKVLHQYKKKGNGFFLLTTSVAALLDHFGNSLLLLTVLPINI